MNAQSMLGMFHAQELLLVSLIRALPPEMRRKIVDEFQQQVEKQSGRPLDKSRRHIVFHHAPSASHPSRRGFPPPAGSRAPPVE